MTIEQDKEDLAAADVRRALEAVLASEPFRASPQLAAFLRFIVETTLRGESDRLKGYTIGVEALGRGEDFDPQIDPIVRVEATRLRRTLERYYAGPGAADPVVFELSRGSYLPTIRRRQEFEDNARPASAASVDEEKAGVTVPLPSVISSGRTTSGSPYNGMPTLAIQPMRITGIPRTQGVFAQTLVEKLGAAFARFDTINIAIIPSSDEHASVARTVGSTPEPIADYTLVGSGEFHEDGTVTARFSLLDVGEGTFVWSRSFDHVGGTADYGAAEDLVVRQLATTLLPPFGVIRANERTKQLASNAGDPRYRCILDASESFRSFDPAQHVRARGCLEALTARDASFAMGFAYLAAVYTREYQYGLGTEPDDPAILDRAVRAARQAVELSPESARAYQMLFAALFAQGDVAAAFAAGDKALALNPYDMTILSDYGGRLIMIGEVERGLQAITRAADEGAVRPPRYQFFLFLGSYLENDMAAASRHASQIVSETYPLGLLARALSAAANGASDEARKAFEELVAIRPAWRNGARAELRRIFPVRAVADRLGDDLLKAGFASE